MTDTEHELYWGWRVGWSSACPPCESFTLLVEQATMPPEESKRSEKLAIPEEDYDDEEIERALEDLNRAMKALNMATWRLEGNVNWGEDKVVRKLCRDIHTLRIVVDERSKGHPHLSGYGDDHDRYLGLVDETPNATLG